ncbi:MAG: hypothetical protein ACPIOQ_70135 [Promethearchaeia archaeon]
MKRSKDFRLLELCSSLQTMGSEANAKAVLAEKAKAKAASKKRNQQV